MLASADLHGRTHELMCAMPMRIAQATAQADRGAAAEEAEPLHGRFGHSGCRRVVQQRIRRRRDGGGR